MTRMQRTAAGDRIRFVPLVLLGYQPEGRLGAERKGPADGEVTSVRRGQRVRGFSGAIFQCGASVSACTVDAAEDLAVLLDSVANDPAAAARAARSEGVNRAFEAVEDVALSAGFHFEGLVVVISAYFALRHANISRHSR